MPSPLRSAPEMKRRGLGEGQAVVPINTFIWERSNRHADYYDHLGEVKPPRR